ncbi:hypothetical protein JCM10212_003157 [Sporobolomyces blumeae]
MGSDLDRPRPFDPDRVPLVNPPATPPPTAAAAAEPARSLRATPAHLARLPATPRSTALFEIRSRHALQSTTSLTISSLATLLADLNASATALAHDRVDRIEQFRQDFMIGALMRQRPLALVDPTDLDLTFDASSQSSLGASSVSLSDDSSLLEPPTTPSGRCGVSQYPLDAVSRGIVAEKTIKSRLAAERTLLPHDDFAPFAKVAKKAIRRTLRWDRPIYVSPGSLHSVDWTDEYAVRGWARPGIRWGPFRPDLVRFQEVKGASHLENGDERVVSWEIVEVKYAGRNRDVIYVNYKVQAVYYHLNLVRILSSIPGLVPSHKVSFFISSDPLASTWVERSVSLRTTLAFVEHHLFVLVPEWLRAVKQTEWDRLQTKLAEPLGPVAQLGEGGGTSKPTFLERLQASNRKPVVATPARARPHPLSSTPSTASRSSTAPAPLSAVPLVQPAPSARTTAPSPAHPSSDDEEEDEVDVSFASARSSPSSSSSRSPPCDLAPSPIEPRSTLPLVRSLRVPEDLPPLPPVDEAEERELWELFERVGLD